MSWEQRNADFCKAQTEAQMAYIEAEREADRLMDENAKLRELVKRMHRHIKQTCDVCDEYYCSNFDEDNECCVFDVLARELGVEVD